MHTTLKQTTKNHDQLHMVYIVNGRIPNERAHGIQIVHTCEALGAQGIDLTLVTSMFPGTHPSLTEQYGVTQSFVHRRIFAIDIPNIPFRYVLRNASFFVSATLYLLWAWCMSIATRRRFVVYVRGELMLFLIPLTYLMPLFLKRIKFEIMQRGTGLHSDMWRVLWW